MFYAEKDLKWRQRPITDNSGHQHVRFEPSLRKGNNRRTVALSWAHGVAEKEAGYQASSKVGCRDIWAGSGCWLASLPPRAFPFLTLLSPQGLCTQWFFPHHTLRSSFHMNNPSIPYSLRWVSSPQGPGLIPQPREQILRMCLRCLPPRL